MAGAVEDGAVERFHATAIAVGRRAALIRGDAGSGKSDLALRCMATQHAPFFEGPARLVADDQVLVMRQGTRLTAYSPPTLIGKIEVRGLGILTVDPVPEADIAFVADIVPRSAVERYPDPWPEVVILGLPVPILRIAAFDASTPLKVLTALANPQLLATEPNDARTPPDTDDGCRK